MQVISGPIGMLHLHYEALPRDYVETEMHLFLEWFNQTLPHTGAPDALYGLTRAALAHFRFVTIHLFEDGNGRLARAITDMTRAQVSSRNKAIRECLQSYFGAGYDYIYLYPGIQEIVQVAGRIGRVMPGWRDPLYEATSR